MNKVVLIGRLTKDINMKFTQEGKAIGRFILAVNRAMKKEEADFISCVVFGKTAETMVQYFKKGHAVALTGAIRTGSYDKDGERRYTQDIIIDTFEFINNKAADKSSNSMEEVFENTPF